MKMTMYFIALVLPKSLDEKVLYWKNYMYQHYGCRVGLKSPAHITIVPPFWMQEENEKMLLADIDDLAITFSPFSIRTKNFSAFKPRTIFIDVEKTDALTGLKDTTDLFFKHNRPYKIQPDSRPFHPHITIATRDLFKKSFYEAWPIFEKERFEEEWLADSLSALRHNKKNWDVIQTSQFIMHSKT